MAAWMHWIIYALVLACGPQAALANEKPGLTLGVFPYVTPVQLAAFHNPLREYLAKNLGRPVTLVTAPDFNSFVDRTRDGQYDIIVTAPHLGRLAETRDGYRRVAQTGHLVQGVFLTRKDSDIQSIEDLKGKTVMMAQKVSIIYQMSEQAMRDKGLVPGESVTIVETRTHNNAMYAPLRGEADASVTGTLLWRVLQDEQKGQMRVIGTSKEAPGFLIMARPGLDKQDIESIKKLLFDFHRMPDSKPYFIATGFESFKPVDERVMSGLDAYTQIFLKPASP